MKLLLVMVGLLFGGTAVAQDVEASRAENRAGLRAHGNGEYETAREHFARAVELNPDSHMSRFNLACATAKTGDIEGAAAIVEEYVRRFPIQAVRVLHDADLEDLWKDDAILARIRSQIRPSGSRVHEIVFERRDEGDLWAVSDDGLDLVQLTDSDVHEREARFSGDGRHLVFRTLEGDRPVLAMWRMNETLPSQQLRVLTYPDGEQRTIDDRVEGFSIADDGRTVLYLRRNSIRERVLRRVDVAGGEPVTLGPVSAATDGPSIAFELDPSLCYHLAPDGSVIVAEATSIGWGSMALTVIRLKDGQREELFSRPPNTWREFRQVTRCELSEDGRVLDLGQMVVTLGDEVTAEPATDDRRMKMYVTRPNETHETDCYEEASRSAPASWKVSRLSYTASDGMAECAWFSTTHVYRWSDDGSTLARISDESTYIEYAPALLGEVLLRTRLRSRTSRPWLILSAPDGEDERPVAPGQFGIWSPHEHLVDEAGAEIRFGPDADAIPEPADDPAPVEMPLEEPVPAATYENDESDCGCDAPGRRRRSPIGPAVLLLAVVAVRRAHDRGAPR